MKRIFLFISLTLLCLAGYSQENTVANDTIRKDALRVYMSENDYISISTMNYIKREIIFINYVRDLKEADLYIIPTYQWTGSGGGAFTFFLVGQNKYAGMADTVVVNSMPDDTEDMIRIKQVKALKMGLMRYVMKTPLSQFFDIRFTQPLKETISTDKWNSWVYSLSLNAYSSGQKHYNTSYMYASVSANRITEKSKFESSLGIDLESEKSRYISVVDNIDTIYLKNTRDEYGYISYVKSINNHWSAGGSVTFQTSIYNNYIHSIRITPGIEYDIFPYSESTRRKLTFLYSIGVDVNKYIEMTSRFKTKEIPGLHLLSTSLSVVQKWGSINSTLTWSNYFFNWSYNKLRLYTNANLRIVKGLSFNIYGSIALIHDQIFLPLGSASLEDVLLNRKALETTYSYYTSFGLTYTFGSIYNNVVNPRFGN
jgi:S-ribosylhomocysteine lyase LuxS involved in autoinducer biosynthesis